MNENEVFVAVTPFPLAFLGCKMKFRSGDEVPLAGFLENTPFPHISFILSGPTADAAEINPLFAVLVGCTLVLVVVLSVAIIAVWKRSRRKPPIAKAYKRENGNGNGDANFETDDSALTKIENGLDEIGNPDVVPNKNGKGEGLDSFLYFLVNSRKSLKIKHYSKIKIS